MFQFLFGLLHFRQNTPQIQRCLERKRKIRHNINRQEERCISQDPPRDMQNELLNRPVNHPRHQNGKKSPCERRTRADMSLKIKFLMGIVPISDVEQRFHKNTRYIFQRRSADTTCQIGQNNIMLKRHGNNIHHNCAASIDGKKRSPHKSAVDKFTRTD